MFSYAQIDAGTGICFCISHLSGEVSGDNLIALIDGNTNVLGKRWTGTNWEEVAKVEEETPLPAEPTNTELQELLLSIMEGLADIYAANVEGVE